MNFTLTDEQVELVLALNKRQDCLGLKNVVRGVELERFQRVTVAFALIVKACLISLDTGLGKTLVATGIMNVVREQKPDKKWLVVVQNSNLSSTYRKIKAGLWNSRIVYSDADSGRVLKKFLSENMTQYDIFVLSYEAVCNPLMNDFLFEYKDQFAGIVIDECQMISNMTSLTSRMLEAVTNCLEYRFPLTATPIRVHPFQMVNIIKMIDPEMFEGMNMAQYRRSFEVKQDGKVVGFKGLERLKLDLAPRFIGRTRKEEGVKGDHTPVIIMCESKPEYKKVSKMNTFQVIKGDIDGPAMRAFRDYVLTKKAKGEKGIAYVNLTENKRRLLEYLGNFDIRVGIMDGSYTGTQAKKDIVHEKFINNEYDVLLTNITTGKDLQCSWIAFYELTFDFQQFVGRGERGLQRNDMELAFFLVRDTAEIAYFYDNVYTRGMFLEILSDKDLDDLKNAYAQIQKELASEWLTGFDGGGFKGSPVWMSDEEAAEIDEDDTE